MHYIILTISNAYDEETHQGGIALYFKHMSRGHDVSWYDAHIQATGEHSTTITHTLMCTTSNNPIFDTVSLYVISHSVGGTFGGFEADLLVPLLQGFLKYSVKVPVDVPMEKLCLIGCGTARGDNGATYISKIGKCWISKHPIKVVAWQAYVTLFDIRFLIKLITDIPQFNRIVNGYAEVCLRLLENSRSTHAAMLMTKLSGELATTIALHRNFKAFTAVFNPAIVGQIQGVADDAIYSLIGKRVIKLPGTPGNYFSNPPGFLVSGASTEGPPPLALSAFGDTRDQLNLLTPMNVARKAALSTALRGLLIQDLIDMILALVGDLFEWHYFPSKAKVSLLRNSAYGS